MTNDEVIERLGYIKQQYNILLGTDIYDEVIDTAIKVLREERPQGEWAVFYTPKKKKVFKCDKCMAVSIQGQTNFCPNCGADMRKGNIE